MVYGPLNKGRKAMNKKFNRVNGAFFPLLYSKKKIKVQSVRLRLWMTLRVEVFVVKIKNVLSYLKMLFFLLRILRYLRLKSIACSRDEWESFKESFHGFEYNKKKYIKIAWNSKVGDINVSNEYWESGFDSENP